MNDSVSNTRTTERLPTPAPVLAVPRRTHLVNDQHPLRKRVEAFIARRFLDAHNANINQFMPLLVAEFNVHGEVLAALGIRAANENLFLEHYLDQPIEEVIAQHPISCQQPVYRNKLAEIGNLASIDRTASMRLFRFMARYLIKQGFDWATFTGCPSLRKMFTRLGIETVSLANASQRRLPPELRHWGSYYDDNPCILAGRVTQGRALFEDIQCEQEVAA